MKTTPVVERKSAHTVHVLAPKVEHVFVPDNRVRDAKYHILASHDPLG